MNKTDFGLDKKFYVAGAHSRAQTLAIYLQYLYPETTVEAYLVNNDENNAKSIQGVPVIKFNQNTKLHCEYPVFIGTRGIYHKHLSSILQQLGMKKIFPVTVDLDLALRNAYLQQYFSSIHRTFAKIDRIDTLGVPNEELPAAAKPETLSSCIYVAKSIFDKELTNKVQLADYEKIIRVGTALSDTHFEKSDIIDCTGDNISSKNKQYCELTGLYWIWKNAKEDIIGLVHYRRHFILPENWLERMQHYNIDVILPLPLYVAPNVAENYQTRHIPTVWTQMMDYLNEHHPSEYEQAVTIFQSNLYSPCNMFIMRKSVLNDLCDWMFPIIDSIAAHEGQYTDSYQNRYPGFLSERLITLFFEMHRDKYKTVYADKNFIS